MTAPRDEYIDGHSHDNFQSPIMGPTRRLEALIAAAPDLLAAAKIALSLLDWREQEAHPPADFDIAAMQATEALQAAIDKAEGRA